MRFILSHPVKVKQYSDSIKGCGAHFRFWDLAGLPERILEPFPHFCSLMALEGLVLQASSVNPRNTLDLDSGHEC